MKKLLIPIDGSENSKKALLEGRKIAEALKSDVHIMYVERLDKLPGAYADVTPLEMARKYDKKPKEEKIGEKAIEEALEVFKDYPGEIKGKVEFGYPAETIIEIADNEKVDLIVMGSRGLSRVSRFVLGSISTKVLNHAKSSVLIVR